MIPVIHELTIATQSFGDVLTGNIEASADRWHDYAKESFIGSGCSSLYFVINHNQEKALAYAKGFGRATGQILSGGGMLQDLPVFQELAACGKSLGDVFVGDFSKASKQWAHEYAGNSVLGSGIMALHEHRLGNSDKAKDYVKSFGKASGRMGVSAAMVLATGGAGVSAASAGRMTGTMFTAKVGGMLSSSGATLCSVIDGKPIVIGDVVSAGLLGAGSGALFGNRVARNRNTARVFRIMPDEEGQYALQNRKFRHGYQQSGPKGETCFSESSSHSRTYLPDKIHQHPNLGYRCYQGTFDKKYLNRVKQEAIPQKNSGAINEKLQKAQQKLKNLRNDERVSGHKSEKSNLILKGPENLAEFNCHVKSIKIINPNSLKHRHPTLKHIVRLGKGGATAIFVHGEHLQTIHQSHQ